MSRVLSNTPEDFYESIAMASEDETILNTYMEQGDTF